MSIKMRQKVEREIAEAVIDGALEAGYTLDVYDTEEVTVKNSASKTEILEAMFTTNEDYLYVRNGGTNPFGWVRFIYGNDGWDVVNDYTTNLEEMMTKANALAESYSD